MTMTRDARVAGVDPDTLCLACLQTGDQSAGCPSCGFDERAAAVSPLHLPPRTILHGQYLLGRALGQGGFGITYLGWDLNLQMPVALKEFLPTEFASRASGQLGVRPYGEDGRVNFGAALEAFDAEARTLARCYDLPGVVDVLNYFRENGTGYIVMPYLRGRTFRDQLRASERPLTFDETVAIMRPVLAALQAVHGAGLVHRDISPDNIYICDTGRVCLLDFGAARNAVRDRSKSLSVQFKVGYTPEEQHRRHGAQGPWTDVYAAAATCYRALTGVPPPPALDRLKQDQLRPPGALGTSLPRRSERAIMRGLAVSPEDRYRTIAEFLEDFAPIPRHDAAHAGASSSASSPPSARHGAAVSASASASVAAASQWVRRAAIDVARVVRWRIDAALQRAAAAASHARAARTASGSSGGSQGAAQERAIRAQLAALWPVTMVSLTLRAPDMPAGPDHGPLDVFARDETGDVGFDVILQNNYAGIQSLWGAVGVAYVDPCGVTRRSAGGAPPFTLELDVCDFVDREAFAGRWGPGPRAAFDPGVWRLELWWDGRKIGERAFVISA